MQDMKNSTSKMNDRNKDRKASDMESRKESKLRAEPRLTPRPVNRNRPALRQGHCFPQQAQAFALQPVAVALERPLHWRSAADPASC